jgi:hypothetical protein
LKEYYVMDSNEMGYFAKESISMARFGKELV